MANGNEASVEEILESIKRVIARDNRDDALAARRQRQADADEAANRAMAAREAVEPVDEEEAEEVLDLAEMDLAEQTEEAESTDMDQPERTSGEADEPLIKAEVRNAMQDNLAALAVLAEPGARPQIVRSGETSLEGLTRELLRPMLAEWLEANLPGMVEAMVRAEIARIAGKRG
jgi:cell pole-organizing protein PopZ